MIIPSDGGDSYSDMNSRRYFILLLVLAFLLRLGALFALRDIHKFHGDQLGADAREFDQLGLSLSRGQGYVLDGHPTAFRAPGFPIYMSVIYRSFGEHYPPQYLALCLMGALTCGITYLAGRELGSEHFARAAGALAALYVPLVYDCTIFASENFFVLCLIGGLLIFLRALRSSAWLFLLAGLCFGWGILTRPALVLAMPPLFLLAIWQGKQFPARALGHGILLAIGCLAVVAPWTMRNYEVFGKPVFVATNGGSTFYGGNNDIVLNQRRFWGGWVSTTKLPGRDLIEAQPDEARHEEKEWQLGLAWVKNHKTALPRLEVFRVVRFWLPDWDSQNKKYVTLQLIGYSPFLVLFAIAAIKWLRHPRWDPGWLSVDVIFLATILTAIIFWGSPRFRDGSAPLLMLYASTAVSPKLLDFVKPVQDAQPQQSFAVMG